MCKCICSCELNTQCIHVIVIFICVYECWCVCVYVCVCVNFVWIGSFIQYFVINYLIFDKIYGKNSKTKHRVQITVPILFIELLIMNTYPDSSNSNRVSFPPPNTRIGQLVCRIRSGEKEKKRKRIFYGFAHFTIYRSRERERVMLLVMNLELFKCNWI